MKLFMTLNSPHLGCQNSDSLLVDAGLWLFTRLKKGLSLKQMSMKDATPENSYVFKLAHTKELGWFENLILVSSAQD